jgi:hypothetical protein
VGRSRATAIAIANHPVFSGQLSLNSCRITSLK